MGDGSFFYPPPPPIISATGAQPYAGNKLPPQVTAVQVDNPPLPWQMIPTWSPRGILPTLPRYVTIPTATVVNNPPFLNEGRGAQQQMVSAISQPDPWVYDYLGGIFGLQPYGIKALNPSITAVPVNNPPFAGEGRGLPNQWVLADPWAYNYLGGGLGRQPYGPETTLYPTSVVVAYPLGTPNDLQYPSILGSWQQQDPLPTLPRNLNPFFTAVKVDFPPFINEWLDQAQGQVNYSWQPPDPQPTLRGKLSPGIPGQSVDNPVPNADFVALSRTIVEQWQPSPPLPFVSYTSWQPLAPNKLSPGIPGQSVDNPPQLARMLPPFAYPEAPYQQPVVKQVQPFVASSVQQAFTSIWLNPILASWQPPDPQPQVKGLLNPSITAVQVDNPPFGLLVTVVEPWIIEYPPQRPNYKLTISGAAPTVQVPYAPQWLPPIILSWQPPDPLPTLPRHLPPSLAAVQVDNPPFSHFGRWALTVNEIFAWQPPDPPPVQRGPLSPQITAVRVDSPPFTGLSRTPNFWTMMAAWEIPLPPMPQQTKYVVHIIPAPIGKSFFSYISSSYIQ